MARMAPRSAGLLQLSGKPAIGQIRSNRREGHVKLVDEIA